MQDKKELQELLKNRVKKLVFLIEESVMPDEIKVSWVKLLPEMSIEQIDKFFDVLEAEYINKETKEIDEKFKLEFLKVAEEMKLKKEKIDQKFENELLKLSNQLDEK